MKSAAPAPAHRGVFFVEGVGDPDGVHYIKHVFRSGVSSRWDSWSLQNGEAPEPPETSDVNGYEFDGSTQFMVLDVDEVLAVLKP